VDQWFDKDANIPKGCDFAFQCLQALGGGRPPTIKILKPQWERDRTQHEITMLAKFSDGERLTTAILLYCVGQAAGPGRKVLQELCATLSPGGAPWPDNLSHRHLLSWRWRDGDERWLIVVNYSQETVQGRVRGSKRKALAACRSSPGRGV
jgi:hypothetical protein